MSGGHFDYQQRGIEDIADRIRNLISTNGKGIKAENDWGEVDNYNFSGDTISEFKQAIRHLNKAYVYAQRIDWLVSGDDGEETFHQRLTEELSQLNQNNII